jgi:hypothetical protein
VKAGELVGTPAGHGDEPGHGDKPGDGALMPAGAGPAWPDRQALDGPFTTRQLLRLDQSLRYADQWTGLVFSVYVGDLDEPVREHAARLHGQLPDRDRGVLLAVSPRQRMLEIVTGPAARRRLPDRDCGLAALSMAAAFAGGDLTGGIVTGLTQLADRAGEL